MRSADAIGNASAFYPEIVVSSGAVWICTWHSLIRSRISLSQPRPHGRDLIISHKFALAELFRTLKGHIRRKIPDTLKIGLAPHIAGSDIGTVCSHH